jgi:excinuclease ABC subunit C
MDFPFQVLPYDKARFISEMLPSIPKSSAVYRVFDTQDKLIVLDRTSNLAKRLDRFYGERSETVKDLDLREITSRIEFIRTASPFETIYLLYLERRRWFPRTYRKMRTFRLFTLMKINRRQRFPRIYASRQIKAGVDYFGPFISRGQFTRMKTALERAFKLRPCLFNIRGNDPHPDCLYFQMRTCSKPCNNDIDRMRYTEDVRSAIAFIQGRDTEIEGPVLEEIATLASAMDFEAAEALRRKLEKTRRARQEMKEVFRSVWDFNFLVVIPSFSTARRRIAFVREGSIVAIEEYEIGAIEQTLPAEVERVYGAPASSLDKERQYDEFCLVSNFLLKPLESTELLPVTAAGDMPGAVLRGIERRRKKEVSAELTAADESSSP